MKRVNGLYDKMCNEELIREAILNAAKGKRSHLNVQRILASIDYYVRIIRRLLETGKFVPSQAIERLVREGGNRKERMISKLPFFPDQVIHWCIYLTLKPWIFNRFYGLSCGSIPGRGVHFGKRFVEKWIKTDRKHTKYYLKMDIRKFYQSVQPEKLLVKLRRIIKDERFLALNAVILRQSPGLPIGMLLSQVYANYFLSDFDFWVKQQLGADYYIRQMDDMVIFSGNKKRLRKMREAISDMLATDGLKLKSNWQVCRLDKEPLDFMGFRFYRDHVSLRRSIMLAITRRVRRADKAGEEVSARTASAVISYLGWIKHSDSHGLFDKWIKPRLHLRRLKNAIRRRAHADISKHKHNPTARVGHAVLPGAGVPQPQRG